MDKQLTPPNIISDLYYIIYYLDKVLRNNNIFYWADGGNVNRRYET